jgi:hypothetical protein
VDYKDVLMLWKNVEVFLYLHREGKSISGGKYIFYEGPDFVRETVSRILY